MLMDIIQKTFGWLAACININFYISPLTSFINIIKGKMNYEDTPGLYITTSYLNCLIWYIYGKMLSNNPIKISYMISGIFTLILMFIYLIFESKKYLCDSILNTFFIVTGTWAIYRALILIIGKIKIVGYIGIGTTLLMYLSPIQKLYKILKRKNYNLIPVFSSWRYLFTSIFWLIYSVFLKNIYLAIPNSLGIIFSLFSIFINICFKRNSSGFPKRDSNGSINIVVGGNDENKKEEIPIKLDDDAPAQNDEKQVKK